MKEKPKGRFMRTVVVLLLFWLFLILPAAGAAYQAIYGMEPIPTWGALIYGAGGVELAGLLAKAIFDSRQKSDTPKKATKPSAKEKQLEAENSRLKEQIGKINAAIGGEQLKLGD
jgi:hypothetical protein